MKNLLAVDRAILPAAMLDAAKAQMRVRHTRDDALILDQLAQAIAAVERKASVNINPAQYEIWMHHLCARDYPAAPQYVRWRLPVNNATDVLSFTDSGGNDHAADYELQQADQGGSADSYLIGPPVYGVDWRLVVDVGMTDPDDIDPALRSVVLRVTAALYENRESFTPIFAEDFVPELIGVWRVGA